MYIAEPPAKKSKLEETNNSNQWDGTEDYKQQVVELLQANLQQLDEVRQTVETQGIDRIKKTLIILSFLKR